ncbi:glutamate receptor ionotropic, kainate 1-like isoform X2 [Scylla paramamosain]|uniref:glutamate receptor ionotropic, kainate 1-like isoform X2 n=1 Tax=Scylla paramamosain TaxID=85552 RepID=UPI0030827497
MATHAQPACLKVYTLAYISGTPGNYQFSGPIMIILEILRDHLGVCLDFVVTEEQAYGVSLRNGSWTGMMGMVQRHEVDFSGMFFTMNYDSLKAVEFSESIHTDEMTAMYIRPRVSPNMMGFVMPYTASVWLFVMAACVVLIGVIMVTVRFQRKFSSTHLLHHSSEPTTRRSVGSSDMIPEQSKTRRLPSGAAAPDGDVSISSGEEDKAVLTGADRDWLWSLEKSLLWTWSTLIAHSVPWQPVGGLVRCVTAMWLLAAFILGNVYRSNLKAMLTIPRINIPFDSVDELADSDVPTAILRGSKMHQQIVVAEDNSTLGRLRDQTVYLNFDQLYLAIDQVLKGKMAGMHYRKLFPGILNDHYSRVMVFLLFATGECGAYVLSRGFLGPSSLCIIFPKGSPLKKKFDPVIMRLKECGLLAKIMAKGYVNATECLKPLTSMVAPSHRPLQLLDFYGIFAVYVAGVTLAAMAFLWEMTRGCGGTRRGAAEPGLWAPSLPARRIISLPRLA